MAADHHTAFAFEAIPSSIDELDNILGGGLSRGTSTLVVGPSGAGKSTLAMGCVFAALERGEPVLIISFDETIAILMQRAKGVGFDFGPHVEAGRLRIEQIDPANVSPGEFAGRVQGAVEKGGARVVVIDSLTGYLNTMPEQSFVVLQMHELLTYLNHRGS